MAADQLMSSYVGHGTHAARPATPNVNTGVSPVYYETDTTNTFVWSGSAWVQVNGGSTPTLSVATKTTTYTISSSDDVILADATSAGFTVSLPTAVGWTKRITIKKIDSSANAVTIGTTGGQTIDGQNTKVLGNQYGAVTLISDNANWRVTEVEPPGLSGGAGWSWTSKSALYTLTAGDTGIAVDTSGGAVTITLPTAVANGQLYGIKKKTSDSNAVTINTTSSQTIDGQASGAIKLGAFNQAIFLASDGANWQVVASPQGYISVQDQKAQNTAGGTFTSGAWQTRTLNTLVTDTTGLASLASNQVTLPAGTYRVWASAPAFACDKHQLRLQNITDSSTLLTGQSNECLAASNVGSVAIVQGMFTITGSKVIELQHRCQTTRATDGFGRTANFTGEVYAILEIFPLL